MTTHDRGAAPAPLERLATGVPGLDVLLDGGLCKASVTLIEGPAGAGKTILGNQISHRHVAHGGRVLYVTLLAETHARMLQHMSQLRFYDARAIPERFYIVSGFRTLLDSGLHGLQELLRSEIARRKISLLVIDGLHTASDVADDTVAFQQFMHGVQTIGACTGCTTLLLSARRDGVLQDAHVLVDGLLELDAELSGNRLLRSITLRKMRGVDLLTGRHAFKISVDGIEVFPRIETIVAADPRSLAAAPPQTTGLPVLDQMCAGGFSGGSTTLLLGPPGIGKTTFGLHFLEPCCGTARGLLLGFYETPACLRAKADALGLHLERALHDGSVDMLWFPIIEASIDEVLSRFVHRLRERKPQRIFIDGLGGIRRLAADAQRLPALFPALSLEIARTGAVALATAEVPTSPDPHDYALNQLSLEGISAAAHNILALRYVEMGAKRRRTVSLLKVRNQPLDSRMHLFDITPGGVVIDPEVVRASSAASSAEAARTRSQRERSRS